MKRVHVRTSFLDLMLVTYLYVSSRRRVPAKTTGSTGHVHPTRLTSDHMYRTERQEVLTVATLGLARERIATREKTPKGKSWT